MIMNKIPCAVIKDLLPSYIDGLTSEDSDRMIEEHLSECAECTELLNSMKAGLSEADEDEKKRNRLSEEKPPEKQMDHFLLRSRSAYYAGHSFCHKIYDRRT